MQAKDLDNKVRDMELKLELERVGIQRRKDLLRALPETSRIFSHNVYSWTPGSYHAAFEVDTFAEVSELLSHLPPMELVFYRNSCAGFVPTGQGEGEIHEIAPVRVEVTPSASDPHRRAPEVKAAWFTTLPEIGEVQITAVVQADESRFSHPRPSMEFHSRRGDSYTLTPSADLGGANRMRYASGSRHIPERPVFYWDRLTKSDPGTKSAVPAWLYAALPE